MYVGVALCFGGRDGMGVKGSFLSARSCPVACAPPPFPSPVQSRPVMTGPRSAPRSGSRTARARPERVADRESRVWGRRPPARLPSGGRACG